MTDNPAHERWQTPPEIWDPLHAEFHFDLDACADHETKRLSQYLTDALDGREWPGKVVFMNPPYGRKLPAFVLEANRQAQEYRKTVVALIPFRCRGAWWHDAILGRAEEVRCIRKRVSFVRLDGTRGDFTGSCDSCIVVWRGPGVKFTRLVAA